LTLQPFRGSNHAHELGALVLTALAVFLLVLGLIGGLILGLRRSAGTGLPPRDVLERAKARASELEAQEKTDGH
jgi:hypothetical protein